MRTQIALVVSFVLVGPLTFFTANASPNFEQVVPENATDFENEQMFVYGEWSYKDNILGTPNTMIPPEGGLRGILYDRGLSCSAEVSDALPIPWQFHDLPKIALIKRGQCFFSQKLLYAQMDGAIGAIVYDNMTFTDDPLSQYGMTIPPDTINITAFYVDQSVGEELYERLKNITQFNLAQTPGNTGFEGDQPGIHLARITMFSGETSGSSAWQYTLITIGVILIASICTSGNQSRIKSVVLPVTF
ncbi:hypothetical protein NQZ79_g708 [Umbelopsis isabellina]|nr:hypothetical protein NQZ79_g708 [Umbelopsis isabellina]